MNTEEKVNKLIKLLIEYLDAAGSRSGSDGAEYIFADILTELNKD